MWSTEEDFSTSGGGFDVSGYGSPSAGTGTPERKSSRKASSVFPVTIKQVLEGSEELVIAGYPVSMLTIVGIVRSVEITSTKIVYSIQDWSGTITGMLWLENGAEDQKQNVIENTYCRLTGTKRIHESNACLFIYNIRPIDSIAELTYHYLQVLHVPVKAEELRLTNENRLNSPMEGTNQMSSNTPNFGGGAADGLQLMPHQLKVYRALQNCRSEPGMNKKELYSTLQQQVNPQDIEKALEFLMTEGHIYNTIDDFHYKITDA